MQIGLKEIRLQYRTSESRHMIPLHVWYTGFGVQQYRVLIKVQVLTGNDILSTIRTKLAAIKLNPLQYLSGSGKTQSITKTDILLAEKYLVSVWNGVKGTTSAETFELRMEMHMKSTVVSLGKHPPTSSVIKEHLNRGFAVVCKSPTLLDSNKVLLNPIHNNWFVENEKLCLSKALKEFPTDLIAIFGCEGRFRCRCKRLVAGQVCVPYCLKSNGDKCKNKQ